MEGGDSSEKMWLPWRRREKSIVWECAPFWDKIKVHGIVERVPVYLIKGGTEVSRKRATFPFVKPSNPHLEDGTVEDVSPSFHFLVATLGRQMFLLFFLERFKPSGSPGGCGSLAQHVGDAPDEHCYCSRSCSELLWCSEGVLA